MSRKHLSRITVQAYAFNALEYSVDGEPVSASSALQADGTQVPFYYEVDGETKARENWVAYQVTEFHTGLIHYSQDATDADTLAYQIAESYLLRKLINVDKI